MTVEKAPQFATATYGGTGPGGGAAAATEEGLGRLNQHYAGEDSAQRNAAAAAKASEAAQNRGAAATQNPADAANVASGANGNQANAIELARRQATGVTPGAGIMSLQSGLQQSSQQQNAMAAGARGSAGLAVSQQNAAANKSNLQQNAFAGAGMMRSQDMSAGRGMYSSLTAQARDQAGQTQDEANRFGLTVAQMNDSHALNMGNAAVAFGGVENGWNGAAFNAATNAYDPLNAQDDANQATQEAKAEWNKRAAAANTEKNS